MQRRTYSILIGSAVALLVILGVVLGTGVFFAGPRAQEQSAASANSASPASASAVAQVATPIASAAASAASAPSAAPTNEALGLTVPSAGSSSSAPATSAAVATALVADSRDALAVQPDASLYQIEATLVPDQHIITGAQTVNLTNTETVPLNELYFRLYVNAPHYNEGGMIVEKVQVNGDGARASLEQGDTALKIALTQPLQPGEMAVVTLQFTTIVPTSGGGYGIFNVADGVWTLYNWHPELAVFENGDWLLNPVTEQGDPTNTDAANYEVRFAAPDDFVVVTSGVDGEHGTSNAPRVAALTRNFVVVASDRFERATRQVGDTLVSSYYLPGSAEGGEIALDTTAKSLAIFEEAFGPYPYTEMDVAQVGLGGGAAGMEATGLIMIAQNLYDSENANPLGSNASQISGAEGANALVFTTAHEVAHQWWYGVVGSDAYQQPWIDESLTNWSSAYYVDQAVDAEAGQVARDLFLGLGYRRLLANGDQRLDQPVDQFSDRAYGGIVYGKGALMYDVLRAELGDAAFFEFLQRYYREQQFGRADGAEWLQTLNEVAGRDMTPFFQKWVEGTNIGKQDLPPGGQLSTLLDR